MNNSPVSIDYKMGDVGNGVAFVGGIGIECLENEAVLVNGLIPDSLTVDVENLLVGWCNRYCFETVILDFANRTVVEQ